MGFRVGGFGVGFGFGFRGRSEQSGLVLFSLTIALALSVVATAQLHLLESYPHASLKATFWPEDFQDSYTPCRQNVKAASRALPSSCTSPGHW